MKTSGIRIKPYLLKEIGSGSVLLPMACMALSMIYMATKKDPDESVIYENLTPSA